MQQISISGSVLNAAPLRQSAKPTIIASALSIPAQLNQTSSADSIRFGHGHGETGGDHFHPMAPFKVYGQSNPYFMPLVQSLIKNSAKRFDENQYANQWILNPEIDGQNNLKSLHLLLSRDGLEQTINALPVSKRPGGYRLAFLKAGAKIFSFGPLKKLGNSLNRQHRATLDKVLDTLGDDLKKNRIFPMLQYSVLTSPKADRYLRAEAAKILVWDYIANYDPAKDKFTFKTLEPFGGFEPTETQADEGRWGKNITQALSHVIAHEKNQPATQSTLADLKKILASKDFAWPHDAYAEKQRHQKHEHDHAHTHGHTHTHDHDHDHDHDHGHTHTQKPAQPHTHKHDHDHDHDHGHTHAPKPGQPQSQKHDHDHDHDHGHSHSHGAKPAHTHAHKHDHGHDHHEETITIHRPKGWDEPKRLAKEVGEKLLVLPLSQPLRPTVKSLMVENPPADWAEQLFDAILKTRKTN